jgi:hypothetical protein
MGRPPKPRNVLEMTGTLRNNPGRYVDIPPEPQTAGPIGDPPEEFRASSEGLKLIALWDKIVAEAPIGLLTVSDREYLADVCRVGVEAKRTGSKGYLRALEVYGKMLKGIGMTPEGRAIRGIGGKVATKEQANPLIDFRKRRRRAI